VDNLALLLSVWWPRTGCGNRHLHLESGNGADQRAASARGENKHRAGMPGARIGALRMAPIAGKPLMTGLTRWRVAGGIPSPHPSVRSRSGQATWRNTYGAPAAGGQQPVGGGPQALHPSPPEGDRV